MKLLYDLSKLDPQIRNQILFTPKYYNWFCQYPDKLLGIDTNAKTVKGFKLGIRTAILYLAPYTMSGINLCAMAHLANCHEPCLNTAGRGAMNNVQMSRLRKSLYWEQFPELFLAQLKSEVITHAKKCIKLNLIPAVRPNGTSDIKWELYLSAFMARTYADYGVQWYDYTKLVNRIVPKCYDLTFSYSGEPLYKSYVRKAIDNGMRIAVVFRNQDSYRDCESFVDTLALYHQRDKVLGGMPIVRGDDHDARFLDPSECVVALYAKGKARHDTSNFVVDTILN
mgnify:CR=1 FL=1